MPEEKRGPATVRVPRKRRLKGVGPETTDGEFLRKLEGGPANRRWIASYAFGTWECSDGSGRNPCYFHDTEESAKAHALKTGHVVTAIVSIGRKRL